MELNATDLRKILPHSRPIQRVKFLSAINSCLAKWGITTPLEMAHFFAQLAHECSSLNRLEENLNYRSVERIRAVFGQRAGKNPYSLVGNPNGLADRVYANRLGNGPEDTHDGWKYRGRGPFGLTGRGNYERYKKASGRDVVTFPSMVSCDPDTAMDTAGWFWRTNDCGEPALRDDIEGVTRKINGGLNGIDDRRKRLVEAKDALGVK